MKAHMLSNAVHRPFLGFARAGFMLAGAFLLTASACSSDDGGGGGGGADASVTGGADASAGAPDAQPSAAACTPVAGFGDLGDLGVAGGEIGSPADPLAVAAPVVGTYFAVELWDGLAPFENGLANGTFEITGDQLDYNLCGACAIVFAQGDGTTADTVYSAQSGTITVTSFEGNFTGTFTPAAGPTQYVGFVGDDLVRDDSCTVTGGGASWDLAIPAAAQ